MPRLKRYHWNGRFDVDTDFSYKDACLEIKVKTDPEQGEGETHSLLLVRSLDDRAGAMIYLDAVQNLAQQQMSLDYLPPAWCGNSDVIGASIYRNVDKVAQSMEEHGYIKSGQPAQDMVTQQTLRELSQVSLFGFLPSPGDPKAPAHDV